MYQCLAIKDFILVFSLNTSEWSIDGSFLSNIDDCHILCLLIYQHIFLAASQTSYLEHFPSRLDVSTNNKHSYFAVESL